MKVKEMITTDEGIFEFVKQHLITQGQKSADIHDNCFYRTSKGTLSCAVGCLIEDEFYNSELEYRNVLTEVVMSALHKSLPNWNINTHLLEDLQNIHDVYQPDEWEIRLEILERKIFGLKERA